MNAIITCVKELFCCHYAGDDPIPIPFSSLPRLEQQSHVTKQILIQKAMYQEQSMPSYCIKLCSFMQTDLSLFEGSNYPINETEQLQALFLENGWHPYFLGAILFEHEADIEEHLDQNLSLLEVHVALSYLLFKKNFNLAEKIVQKKGSCIEPFLWEEAAGANAERIVSFFEKRYLTEKALIIIEDLGNALPPFETCQWLDQTIQAQIKNNPTPYLNAPFREKEMLEKLLHAHGWHPYFLGAVFLRSREDLSNYSKEPLSVFEIHFSIYFLAGNSQYELAKMILDAGKKMSPDFFDLLYSKACSLSQTATIEFLSQYAENELEGDESDYKEEIHK